MTTVNYRQEYHEKQINKIFPGMKIIHNAEVVHDSGWDCDFDAYVTQDTAGNFYLLHTDHGHFYKIQDPGTFVREQFTRQIDVSHLSGKSKKEALTAHRKQWSKMGSYFGVSS